MRTLREAYIYTVLLSLYIHFHKIRLFPILHRGIGQLQICSSIIDAGQIPAAARIALAAQDLIRCIFPAV